MAYGVAVGVVFAFLAGLGFGFNIVFVRAASGRMSSQTIVLLSLILGTPILLAAAALSGQLWSLSMRGWSLYALAGVLHFVVGRSLLYYSIGRIGAASAAVSASPSIVIASILAWILLGEGIGFRLGASVTLISIAVYLVGTKPSGMGAGPRDRILGLAAGLAAAFVYASTTLLVRYTGESSGFPVAGVFASYLAALAVMLPYTLVIKGFPREILVADKYLGFALAAGILVSVGQMLRYEALSLIPVALVVVFVSMNSVYAALLSPLVGSAREKPGLRHLVAAILAVTALSLAAMGA